MAEQLKGVQVNDTFVVDVKEDGVSIAGYPKTYSILNAVGQFPTITKDQWNREPFGNQEQRREAFLDNIAATEGVSRATIDASRTNRMWMYTPSGGGAAVASPPNGTPVTAIAPGVNLRGRTITFQNTSKPFSWTTPQSSFGAYGMLMIERTTGVITGTPDRALFVAASTDLTSVSGICLTEISSSGAASTAMQYFYYHNAVGGTASIVIPQPWPSADGWQSALSYTFPDDADYIVHENTLGIIEGEVSVTDPAVNWSFRDAILTA